MKRALRWSLILAFVLSIGIITYLNRAKYAPVGLIQKVVRAKTPVQVVTLTPATLVESLHKTALLQADQDIVLVSEVAGKIKRIAKNLGDSCQKQQLFLQLDAESYHLAVRDAEAALRQSQIAVEQAKREHQRTLKLTQQSAMPQQALDQSQTAMSSAVVTGQRAEAALALARRNLRETSIRCPFNGVIATRMVDVGQMVGPQTPLARLVDPSRLKLEMAVSAEELARISVGLKAWVAPQFAPQQRYEATIARIGIAADNATRTFPVEVVLDKPPPTLRPGQIARIIVSLATHHDVLAVPRDALLDGPALLLAREGKTQRVPVTTGPIVKQQTIISHGVQPGDVVIVVGQHQLKSGDAIEIIPSKNQPVKQASERIPAPAESPFSPTAHSTP